DHAPQDEPGREDPRAPRAPQEGGPRSEVRACLDLLRPTEEAGTGHARRGRGRARDLRRAVGNPRRRSSEARRVRRRHAQLTTRVHDKRPASQTRFAVAGLFVGRSKGSRCEAAPKAAREPYFEYGERAADGANELAWAQPTHAA